MENFRQNSHCRSNKFACTHTYIYIYRELVYVGNTRNTEHPTHIINIHNCLSLSCLLYNLQCIHSSGVECYSDRCTTSSHFKIK